MNYFDIRLVTCALLTGMDTGDVTALISGCIFALTCCSHRLRFQMIRDYKQTDTQRLVYNTTHTHTDGGKQSDTQRNICLTQIQHTHTQVDASTKYDNDVFLQLPPLREHTHKHTPLLRAYRSQRSRFITPESLSVHEGATLSSERQKEGRSRLRWWKKNGR